MFEFNLRSDIKRFTRELDRFTQQQVPFATAQAINAVALKVQDAEREQLEKSFDKPTPFTVKSVAVQKANKSNRTAVVYIRPIAAKYLAPYADGGTQVLPGTSRAVLNPKDSALLNTYGGIRRNTIARLRNRSDVFIGAVKTHNGEEIRGIWQRPTFKSANNRRGKRKRTRGANTTGRLRLLIRFSDPEPVKKRLPFGATAAAIINRNLQPEFDKALTQAIKTAR
jgi:hypothetical protein